MGLSGMSPLSLVLILVIVVVIFGTKRLRNIGSDLGSAVKSFRKGIEDGESANSKDQSRDDRANDSMPK